MANKPDHKALRRHFMHSLYSTLDGAVSPTPYLEITEGDRVDVKFLNGKGRLPAPNTTEVTVLDIDAASLFFDDFHILYEGVTGIGKTYTSDALFQSVFGPDGQYTLRLSGGVLGSSALEPFTTTIMENGVPKTHIDPKKCQQYGALFIDEINRGDSQEVFQVVDGTIHVNGDTGYLRVPIPGTDRHKGLAIIAAMNPADAQHSSALELDLAGENRFLKFRFPNGVAEAASSQLDKRVRGDLHDKLWTTFNEKAGTKGGWRELYPIITDPEHMPAELNGQTREFIDVALGYVGENPSIAYDRNADLMAQAGIEPHFSLRADNDLEKIVEAQKNLKHGFVRRDLQKIDNLTRLLALIKGVKAGTYDADASLNDVAASIGIVLESKTVTGTEHGQLMNLVNDALASYNELHREMNAPTGYGIRQAVWQSAVHAGTERGFTGYMNTLQRGIGALNAQASTPARATLLSRAVADLAVLTHFSKSHEADVTAALKEGSERAFDAFAQVYETNKARSSVYEHRIGSILR